MAAAENTAAAATKKGLKMLDKTAGYKTFFFNALAVLVLLAQYFGFQDFQLDPVLQGLVIAIANFALRFVTHTYPLNRG